MSHVDPVDDLLAECDAIEVEEGPDTVFPEESTRVPQLPDLDTRQQCFRSRLNLVRKELEDGHARALTVLEQLESEAQAVQEETTQLRVRLGAELLAKGGGGAGIGKPMMQVLPGSAAPSTSTREKDTREAKSCSAGLGGELRSKAPPLPQAPGVKVLEVGVTRRRLQAVVPASSASGAPLSDGRRPQSQRSSVSTTMENSFSFMRFGQPFRQTAGIVEARPSWRSSEHNGTVVKAKKQRACMAFFCDTEAMKEKVRAQVCKPEYSVTGYYKDTGIFQKIARSSPFEWVSLTVILLNSLWAGYEVDQNGEAVLSKAPVGFQVMEHLFCFFFLSELSIRFFAFEDKRNCLRDFWFVFDSALVALTVVDTWVVTIILASGSLDSGSLGNMEVFRLLRLLRVSRVARILHLLKAVPELTILVKALTMATQTVVITIVFLMLIIYVFAIVFMQLFPPGPLRQKYFASLGQTMSSLLLDAILPDQAPIVRAVSEESVVYGLLMGLFILFGSLILMNMLIGIIVEVVKAVSDVEKEQLQVSSLTNELKRLQGHNEDGNQMISRAGYEELFHKPEAIQALTNLGVDVVGILDLVDGMFTEANNHEIPFSAFMEVMLQLRGSNMATLKDVLDLRKWMSSELVKLVSGTLEGSSSDVLEGSGL